MAILFPQLSQTFFKMAGGLSLTYNSIYRISLKVFGNADIEMYIALL
jgi:hypothetical protein